MASYRDTFKLLLGFAAERTGRAPSRLQLEDLDAPLIGAFLDHLETKRSNAVRTRNARLAAVHSMFRFAALRHPEHAALIARVLAIPPKRTERAVVQFLTEDEIDALLASPDRSSWIGRRTTRCCSSPSRPVCGSLSWSGCAVRTCNSGPALTCAALAKGVKSGSRR